MMSWSTAFKCAGILAHWEGDAIIAGIGINVSQTEFPEGLDTPATSLLLRGARPQNVKTSWWSSSNPLIALWKSLRATRMKFCAALWRHPTYARGRRVRVTQEGRTLEGVTCGLDASGFLLLREDNGAQTTILAGGVRPAIKDFYAFSRSTSATRISPSARSTAPR